MDYRTSWMSLIADKTRLGDIAIPGTHDSATHSVSLAWSRIVPRLGRFVQCQSIDLRKQLDMGVRFIDLRFMPEDNFRLHHGSYKLDGHLNEALDVVESFLSANKSETVLVSIKQESDDHRAATADALVTFFKGRKAGLYYGGPTIPRLEDVRGKIVLINRVFEKPGLGPFVWFDYNAAFSKTQTQAKVMEPVKQADGSMKDELVEHKVEFAVQDVCDPEPRSGQSAYDRKLEAIRSGYRDYAGGTPDLRIAFLSASRPATWTPGDLAQKINPQVAALLRENAGGKRWITVLDYVGKYGDGADEPVANVISTNALTKGRPAGQRDTLKTDETLAPGDTLVSANGAFEARFQQTDGNFVVYRVVDDFPLRATMTDGRGATRATLHADGNFVVYAGQKPLSATDTDGKAVVRIVMQDDGNLVAYDKAGSAHWASWSDDFRRKG